MSSPRFAWPTRIALATLAAGPVIACTAIIGTRDLDYVEAGDGSPDAGREDSALVDAPGTTDVDAAPACEGADLTRDSHHCGRCGHDCLGGECSAGKCGAITLGTVNETRLRGIAVSSQYVFVTTRSTTGSMWRIPIDGGMPEIYVNLRFTHAPVVHGDRLYFLISADPEDGTNHGGLWWCPLVGAAPCTPQLVTPTDGSTSLVADGNRLVFNDNAGSKGWVAYEGGSMTVVRGGFNFSFIETFVQGPNLYYGVTVTGAPRRGVVFEVLPDSGVVERSRYENTLADFGTLTGNATHLFFSSYDFEGSSNGIVRRLPRAGGTGCDYGGTGNRRPFAVHVDATHVYWTNSGQGTESPFTSGSVAACTIDSCCPTPEHVMWEGDGEPGVLTSDAKAVYFLATLNGIVRKIAKP